MNDAIQSEDLAKHDLREHDRLREMRQPWEETFREVDDRFPTGAGGFIKQSPGRIRGQRNYDSTHVIALERFAAAGVAITTPEGQHYIKPRFADEELMKERNVRIWCERAGRRLYDIRHAQHTGFITAANEDWDQLGRYGTSAIWSEARQGRGMFYRTLHLSSCWIDVDYAGLVDTVHRKFEGTARQLAQQFGKDNLTPKMLEALEDPNKQSLKFEILHVVCPNTDYDADTFDHRRFPIASRYLATDEKLYVRRRGFNTMPVSVSRHATSPEEIYGRSPAIQQMSPIHGVNAIKLDALRASKKAVDPALIFSADMGLTTIKTKAGGLNPGLVDETTGRPLVHRMPGGENGIPFAIEMLQDDRATIKTAFLEDFYKILTDPNSRMTTTEVLEVMSKQGILVRPFASRYAMEKQHPMTNRDLELALEAGQIEPLPPEAREAGAWPIIDYENPLAAMARAEKVSKTNRWLESAQPLVAIDEEAKDWVDSEMILKGSAQDLGVDPEYVRSAEVVAGIRKKRGEDQQAAVDAELLKNAAGASKDLAQAAAIGEGR